MRKTITTIVLAALALVALVACEDQNADRARVDDERQAGAQLNRYQDAQPVPEFDWSQLRQNLIEIGAAQVQTTATTSFFFNLGITDPVASCPSIGYPIPSTYQLSNPAQVTTGSAVVPQLESNGVYTGDSSGTYVMCVNADGQAYALYWEGHVMAVSGAAEFADGQVRLVGAPSFDFSEAR